MSNMRISVFVFSVMRDSYHAGGGKHHMGKLLQFLVTDATKEDEYTILVQNQEVNQEAAKPNQS